MSYICYTHDGFAHLDSSVRGGVFCKLFSSSGRYKLYTLQSGSTTHYSMGMDNSYNLQILCVSQGTQLCLYNLNGSQFQKKIISTADEGNYFINPYIYLHNNDMNIIYISHTNNSEYSIYHQNLEEGIPRLVGTLPRSPLELKYMFSNGSAYISYINPTDLGNINIIKVNPSIRANELNISTYKLLSIPQPIENYSFYLLNNVFHIVYVTKTNDSYNLYYTNSSNPNSTNLLSSSNSPMSPIIFYYLNGIWINTFINNKLHTILSMNFGKTFSVPVNTSLRNNPKKATFIAHGLKYLTANELYIISDHHLKLCTISSIDFEGLHPSTTYPTELELLLEAFLLHTYNEKNYSSSAMSSKMSTSFGIENTLIPNQIPSRLNTTPNNNSTNCSNLDTIDVNNNIDQDINTATKNFMEEFSSFNIPPKLK